MSWPCPVRSDSSCTTLKTPPSHPDWPNSISIRPGPCAGVAVVPWKRFQLARSIEEQALSDWADWISGLQRFGLDADRRALRLAVADMHWHWTDEVLEIGFRLVAGAYATAVLREIVRA